MQKICACITLISLSPTSYADSGLLPGRTAYQPSPETVALEMPYQGEPFAFILRGGQERPQRAPATHSLGALILWIPPTDFMSSTRLEVGLRENSRFDGVHSVALTAGYGLSFTRHFVGNARFWWGRAFGAEKRFDYGLEGGLNFEWGPALIGANCGVPVYLKGSEFSWKGLSDGVENRGFRFGIEVGFKLLPRGVLGL